MRYPSSPSRRADSLGLLPNSVMFARSGPGTCARTKRTRPRPQCLGEDHVGAGPGTEPAPYRLLESERRPRVGARDDDQVLPGGRGGADLLGEDLGLDDPGPLEVPAALRVDLVLELDRGTSRALQLSDGAHHVEGAPEAGVGVDDEGDAGHPDDLTGGAPSSSSVTRPTSGMPIEAENAAPDR